MSTNHQVFLFLVEVNGTEVLKEANGSGEPPVQDITTDVNPGDSIEWRFDTNSGIASINRIVPTVDDLLSNLTTGGQNGWATAGIHSNAPLNETYDYEIYYTPSGTETEKKGDPKIRVNGHQ